MCSFSFSARSSLTHTVILTKPVAKELPVLYTHKWCTDLPFSICSWSVLSFWEMQFGMVSVGLYVRGTWQFDGSSNVLLSCSCDWLIQSDNVMGWRIYRSERCPIKDCYHAATHTCNTMHVVLSQTAVHSTLDLIFIACNGYVSYCTFYLSYSAQETDIFMAQLGKEK